MYRTLGGNLMNGNLRLWPFQPFGGGGILICENLVNIMRDF